MLDVGYAFISAYLKGEEAKIVTSEHVSGMIKASSLQEVLGVIGDTDVGDYLEGVSISDFDDLDKHLWSYFSGCLERLEWFKTTPPDIVKILKAYIVKYDILNIKAALQGISTGKKASMIPVGVIHNHGLLGELSGAGDVDAIVALLSECRLEGYASIINDYSIDEGVKLELSAESKLDGEYYKNLLSIIKGVKDGSLLSRAFGTIIDMTNLQIILRAIIGDMGSEAAGHTLGGGYITSEAVIRDLISLKLNDIPGRLENTQYHEAVQEVIGNYDRNKSITAVEEVIEKHKFRLSKEVLSPRVLSPVVAIWYLILKEIEIRNLRLILKAIFDNTPVEGIRDYLVLSS